MARLLALSLTVLLVGSYAAYALLQPVGTLQPITTFHFSRAATLVRLVWPTRGAAAVGALGYGVLEQHGSERAVPTASTIKVLTALAVLQRRPLRVGQAGPLITITPADVASYDKYAAEDGSVVRVRLGEQLSEYQALQALLLPSANNMAETLARWAFGSINSFSTYANQLAQTLTMTSTVVTDPSGFLPSTISTPHDLVLLGESALANPVVAQIVDQRSASIPVEGLVRNRNTLLGQEGIIGVKTGNSDQDPGCYIFAAKQKAGGGTVTIVGALMNGVDLWSTMQSALPLLKSTAHGFVDLPIVSAHASVARYSVAWQGQARAETQHAITLLVWRDSATSVTVHTGTLSAPAAAGHLVGTLTIHNSRQTDVSVQVMLSQGINTPSVLWRLTHPR